MSYIDKDELANYIVFKNIELNNYNISPVKLQKTIYLLYSMWVRNSIIVNNDIDFNEVCEQDIMLKLDLFNPSFEAWRYGVVDSDIYYNHKNGLYKGSNKLNINTNDKNTKSEIRLFIDEVIFECLKLSDFTLIEVSQGNAWKSTYKEGHRIKIPKQLIVEECYNKLKG